MNVGDAMTMGCVTFFIPYYLSFNRILKFHRFHGYTSQIPDDGLDHLAYMLYICFTIRLLYAQSKVRCSQYVRPNSIISIILSQETMFMQTSGSRMACHGGSAQCGDYVLDVYWHLTLLCLRWPM